jgi:hypothetical protein
VRRLLPALLVLLAAGPARAADDDAAPPRRPAAEVVPMRFAWPAPARAKVSYRRTRARPGQKPGTFTARYEIAVDAAAATEPGLRIATHGTTWRGDLPFPPALAPEAVRATEAVVQRVRPQGEFAGLEGVEALRPVLARVLEDARVPPEQAERALALALAATRAEAEEVWNLAVGFWSGADLRLGQTYVLQSEAELPLVPGRRVPQTVEFGVRLRVPCDAAERAPRCVEAWLRSTPDRAALEKVAPALRARLGQEPPAPEDDAEAAGPPPGELSAERTLVLVTEPGTLLPRRVVWTKAVRIGGDGHAPPQAEEIDRSEWDYRWLSPAPARPKRAPARPALHPPSPPA